MDSMILHPGECCIKKLKRLKEKIEEKTYKLPIYLLIKVNGITHSFTLKNLKQIKILSSKTDNVCGKKECPVVKLLDKKIKIIIDSHESCSLNVSRDKNGKAIFLSDSFDEIDTED